MRNNTAQMGVLEISVAYLWISVALWALNLVAGSNPYCSTYMSSNLVVKIGNVDERE